MGSTVFAVFLPLALALVMFGLGLTLTVADFGRVLRYPKAAVIALGCQMLVLPALCFGLIHLFGLHGALAAGMLVLAAAPGGASANLFSHIAGGDVALNITLTAINSVLSVFTMPLVIAVSYAQFLDENAAVALRPDKFLQVFAIMLIPVAIGMWTRHRFTAWAERRRSTVKITSIVVLALVVTVAAVREFDTLTENIGSLTAICLSLATLGLLIGYLIPRLFGIDHDQAIASTMEVGIQNGAVAIAIATTVLHNPAMAVPPAVYGVLMNLPAGIAAYLLARRIRRPTPGQAQPDTPDASSVRRP